MHRTRATLVPLLWLLGACDVVTPPTPPAPPVVEQPAQAPKPAPQPTKTALHRTEFRQADGPMTVLLHGYGSNEQDMGGLAQRLNFKGSWVGYRAPIIMRDNRFAWFPVNFNATDKRYNDEDVSNAADKVIAALEAEGRPVRLAGFSQGGMLSFYVALKRPDLVTEAISFSGPGPMPATYEKPLKARMLLVHGTEDPVVVLTRAHGVRDALTAAGGDFTYYEVPGMAHQITNEVIQFATSWSRDVP